MRRVLLIAAALAIALAAFTVPGSPLRDAFIDDGDDGRAPRAIGEIQPLPSPSRVEDEATPGGSECHAIEVVIDGRTYYADFAILQDRIVLHSPIRLSTEDGEFMELPGTAVDAIYTRRCSEWDGKCDTLYLLALEDSPEGVYAEVILKKKEAGKVTWENIHSRTELTSGDMSRAEPTGVFCHRESV